MYLLTLASNNYFSSLQTRVESEFLRAGECIGKKKSETKCGNQQ